MSGSLHTWYSLRDLEAFGVRQVVLSDEIELRQLARLADLLHSNSGSVKASLRFRQRRGGWLGLELEYETSVELLCQRCLEPVRQQLADRIVFPPALVGRYWHDRETGFTAPVHIELRRMQLW